MDQNGKVDIEIMVNSHFIPCIMYIDTLALDMVQTILFINGDGQLYNLNIFFRENLRHFLSIPVQIQYLPLTFKGL